MKPGWDGYAPTRIEQAVESSHSVLCSQKISTNTFIFQKSSCQQDSSHKLFTIFIGKDHALLWEIEASNMAKWDLSAQPPEAYCY
jgi:hypothetical protein